MVAAGVAAAVWLGVGLVLSAAALVVGAATGRVVDLTFADLADPLTFAVGNLVLAALIPAAMLSMWVAHRVRPGTLSSVAGRLRWGWLWRCALVLTPLWCGYLALAVLGVVGGADPAAGGTQPITLDPPANWPVLAALILLTTPFQAAGEEYVFRGWLMQNLGVWLRSRRVALAVSIVASMGLFGLAHGSPDAWIMVDLGGFAAATVLMTWRTGGLEAAIVLHVVNNVAGLLVALALGELGSAFITPETTSTPATALSSLAALALATAAVWVLAARTGVARRHTPPPPPAWPPA